jgi:hypothetical protein
MQRGLNKIFTVVYQPKKNTRFAEKRRFAVGAYSLSKYIGEKNAITAIQRALQSDQDKYTVRLRAHGSVEFYFK